MKPFRTPLILGFLAAGRPSPAPCHCRRRLMRSRRACPIPSLYSGMRWRSVGPARGGRSIAVGRQRCAAAGVLVRRHRRRRLEDHRRRHQLDADDRRQDQHLVHRLARGVPVESRRRLHRRRRDAVPRQHHPGRRRLQDDRRRREVGSPHRPARLAGDRPAARAPDQLRHRLRRGAGPGLQRASAARHLQVGRRRQDLAPHAVPRREDRRRRPVDRSEEPERDLRRAVGGQPHAVGHVERRPRQRPVQVHRRRRHLDRDHQEPRPARRPVGQGRRLGVAGADGNRVYTLIENEAGRRPLRVGRCRRDVEDDQRQPQHPPARVLLHARRTPTRRTRTPSTS